MRLFGWFSVISFLTFPAQDVFAQASDLFLKITFPARYDTFDVNRLRIAGATNPHASVLINDIKTKVYPHGAFVGRVELQPGLNKITVKSQRLGLVVVDTIRAFRMEPLTLTPIIPTAFDARLLEPAADLWLMPGDWLDVVCKGSPGAKAELDVEGVPQARSLTPTLKKPPGCYAASIAIGDWPRERPLLLTYSLHGQDGIRQQLNAPGRLTVLSTEKPMTGWTIPETNLWNAPVEGAVLSVLPDSIPLQVIGKIGRRYKVRLSKNMSAYIEETEMHSLPQTMTMNITATPVSAPAIAYERDWLRLDMKVNHPIPFIIEQTVDPPTLELSLYDGYVSSQWITYPSPNSQIKRITWTQPEEQVIKWRIELDQKQQWGHFVVFQDDRLSFYIRRTPEKSSDPAKPLDGLIIAIDPGHGGSETGAVSPIGLEEKTINLKYAEYLADYIRKAGGAVVFTRSSDTLMTILQRIDKARQARAHLYLWLHNNSVGPDADAGRVRGTSAYFKIPQDQVLAYKVYGRLLRTGLEPYGCIHQSYTVTRVRDMLVVLVEGAFMSNPQDEQLLMQPPFLKRLAAAVYAGVLDFVNGSR